MSILKASDSDIDRVSQEILALRDSLTENRSLLVGLSGIDGSGKGFIAKQILADLWRRSVNAVGLTVDDWLNLPQVRFNPDRPAEHFYRHGIRFDEMFTQLILPLRDRRSHRVIADVAEKTANQFKKKNFSFFDVSVIILEGIFLFKKEFRGHFDLAIWIDCSFETALARAIDRAQEGLPPGDTIRAYETIYFAAQRLHTSRDNPRAVADLIIDNDATTTKSSSLASGPTTKLYDEIVGPMA